MIHYVFESKRSTRATRWEIHKSNGTIDQTHNKLVLRKIFTSVSLSVLQPLRSTKTILLSALTPTVSFVFALASST